jgi:hypothetical protein
VVPESPTAQGSPTEEQQQPGGHDTEDKTNEEHPSPSDTEAEKMYRDADEVESFGAEALALAGWLWARLEHLGITTAPRYRIKEVPRPGQVESKAITEIFFGSRILCKHKGPAFRTTRSDAVADAAWQAITSWLRSNKSRLQNSVHYLLPYRKKNQFKANGVMKDIPRMEMVHHQDVTVELSTHLLATQHEIETLCIQLQNADATIRGYMRMVDVRPVTSTRPTPIPGQPPPRSRVQARSLRGAVIPPPDPTLTRSHPSYVKVVSCIVWMFDCMLVSARCESWDCFGTLSMTSSLK